ncbi:adhesion G-protein coupled receptor G2-like [Sinocyclocheilus anshuiensis]|uniref:adhesion G-protein coupled receptor G2-like n=1 Tax=Sinocyclocheilus anshuiensis TaxID=1608454 RepID=UPI0007B9D0CC|nr:PREDICTED: adhesion G-protein coupled receptor G2-like [Sinocyclocheilus anshuiensis]
MRRLSMGNRFNTATGIVHQFSDEQVDIQRFQTLLLEAPNDKSGVFDQGIVEKKAIHGIININNSEQSKTYYQEDLSIIVVKMNLSTTNDFVQIAAPGVLNYDEVADTQIPVEPFKNENESKIGIVTYDSDQHLKVQIPPIYDFQARNKLFASKVIRIEVPERDIVNLINPLNMSFKLNYTNDTSLYLKNYNLSCQFYDENGDGTWKADGCNTTAISDNVVECYCNHMTPFAVLLISLNDSTISEKQWEILSYISYVGCGLSTFFSATTVLSFIFNSNARAEVSSSIHVSLSGALFLLNMSFMLSEWAATLTVKEVCVFIAGTIHYSLLCSFTWMAVEALHLYLLLIRVFNIYIRHYMVKLSLIGWGVPAVIVGGLLSVNNMYGITEMKFSDTNTTNQICWIRDPHVLYGVNIFYFSIVFLFNLAILITVSRQILRLRHVGNRHDKMQVWKDAGTVLGLMCLVGTTWGLAFFSYGYINYPILYLFCILNTMQGFYIFVWMCATARKNRAQTPHSKSKSTLDTSK